MNYNFGRISASIYVSNYYVKYLLKKKKKNLLCMYVVKDMNRVACNKLAGFPKSCTAELATDVVFVYE